jgi:hypothetical protein
MATNIYFQNSITDQNLLNEINREVIQQAGIDVMYIPRTLVKEDLILNEDVISQFNTAYEIEMYVKSSDNFGGPDDAISRFGLDISDELILVVHAESFKFATNITTPVEGDLIYFPLSKGLFEIKFVEDEQPFYQVGKNYVFELTCEVFQYGEEKIDTGTDADKVERENAYAVDLVLTAGGTGTYIIDEAVYQGANLAGATGKGIVAAWTSSTRTLRVNNIVGTFAISTNITGATSGAVWSQAAATDDQLLPTTPYADNKIFETDGDAILDFSESDPFSEGDL